MVKISEVIKEFAGKDECVHFQFSQCGKTSAAKKLSKDRIRLASAEISLPLSICGESLHELHKWEIMLIAIPKEKVDEFAKAHDSELPLNAEKLFCCDCGCQLEEEQEEDLERQGSIRCEECFKKHDEEMSLEE